MTSRFDATDPRDKVFALVGLTSDIEKSFVDYSKSNEDVMKELNLMLLDGRIEATMGSVLDIWSLLTREEDNEITEPSWVVDLFKIQDSMYTPMMTGYPSTSPEIERKPEIHFPTEDGNELSGAHSAATARPSAHSTHLKTEAASTHTSLIFAL
ncbi:hypothetical protein J4E91_010843 [Alternaria rosae]|nr:hypothetical protein J4E91_010843 [Alternaria rosae]